MLFKDFYRYKITLRNGRVFEQETPQSNTGFKFDQEVEKLELIPVEKDLSPITVFVPDGAKLIYYKRHIGQVKFGNRCKTVDKNGSGDLFHIYLIGWKKLIKGQNCKHILYVYPGGFIEDSQDEPKFVKTYIELTKVWQLKNSKTLLKES